MRSPARPRLRALLIGAVLASTATVAAPAEAAPTCWGAGCSGRSPIGTTCADDARTVDSFTVTLDSPSSDTEDYVSWKVELRYSPSCAASWSRATGKIHKIPPLVTGQNIKLGIWSRLDPSIPVTTDPTHYQVVRTIPTKGLPSFQFSTPMVNDNQNYQVRSCTWPYTRTGCTPWQHL